MSPEPPGADPEKGEPSKAPHPLRVGRPPLYGGHPAAGTGLYARMLAGERGLSTSALRVLAGVASLGLRSGVWLRNRLYDRGLPPCRSHAASIPVISVGNLSVGGTGKSLAALLLAEQVLAQGRRPAIVARGYRADEELGDEAQEQQARLGSGALVFCNPDRLAGVAAAAAAGAEVAILDDGFQHRRLRRDLDLLCIDMLDPPGARHLLPLGLLREPIDAVRRAHGVLLTRADVAGDDAVTGWRDRLRATGFAGPIATAAHRPRRLVPLDSSEAHRSPESLCDAEVVLVSGLGSPRGFEATVASLGARIACHFAFPDHHRYGLRDVALVRKAVSSRPRAMLLTTGKDAVKLKPLAGADPWWVLEVGIELQTGGQELSSLLAGVLARAGTTAAPVT